MRDRCSERDRGRPTVAYVDAGALRANLETVRARLAPGVCLLAVVKADGYGHGATLVAPELQRAGADWFGVATVDEAIELRRAGVQQPILVLTGARADEVEALVQCRLGVALLDVDAARSLAEGLAGVSLAVHIKVDTGMGRLGVAIEALPKLLDVLEQLPQLRVEGVFSHFADADDASGAFTSAQVTLFQRCVEMIRARGLRPRWVHLANSVATLTRPESHGTLVRPGIALYGARPPGVPSDIPLRPAMRLCTAIWQLKSVPSGTPLSYGGTFVTRRASRIAILPIGYADGYARALSNRAAVLLRGRRAPVVGRVCMDLTLVDVTDIPGAAAGDEVVLWGSQGDASLAVEEVAGWQESIAYEVLTRLGKRVPRVLTGANRG